ncbi:MAG: McrC family protein [Solirubrobacterales bacterium]
MTDLHLVEGGGSVVVRLEDNVGDALSASKLVEAHRLGGGAWEVSPLARVGVASIAGVTVWIRPKIDIRRILFLMGYARDPGWRTDLVDLEQVGDLLPVLAWAFADQAERAVQLGLLQGYVETDDSLAVLRGRLRDADQLRQRFGLAVPLLVRYDDYTVDIAENRILRAATELLLRLPGVDDATRVRLRGMRLLLAEVAPVPAGLPPRWRPTRLNARYHVALWLAELIMSGDAVDHVPGDVRINGFIVDMAKVFEDFLVAALIRSLNAIAGVCRPQDPNYLDAGSRIKMAPDLVWYVEGLPAAVIDAKYKAEKPAGFPNADIYQMLAYCTALSLPEGHLVYAKGNEESAAHQVRNADVTISTHTIDLQLLPAELLAQVDALARVVACSSEVIAP